MPSQFKHALRSKKKVTVLLDPFVQCSKDKLKYKLFKFTERDFKMVKPNFDYSENVGKEEEI